MSQKSSKWLAFKVPRKETVRIQPHIAYRFKTITTPNKHNVISLLALLIEEAFRMELKALSKVGIHPNVVRLLEDYQGFNKLKTYRVQQMYSNSMAVQL